MGRRTDDDSYTDEEAERRMIDALRRALSTPHKPHQPLGAKRKTTKKKRTRKSPPRS